MSKRQALGVISTNSTTFGSTAVAVAGAGGAVGASAIAPLKASISQNKLHQVNSSSSLVNNENQPSLNTLKLHQQQQQQPHSNSVPKELCEFDIFQEDGDVSNADAAAALANLIDCKLHSNGKKEEKKVEEVETEEEEDDYDEDYEEEEYEEEEEEDDDDDDDDEELEEEEEEEEGFSCLNMAVKSELLNTVTTTTTIDEHVPSPMALDDTIKFQSLISNIEDGLNDQNHLNDEDDEEAAVAEEEDIKKMEAQERDNILMNCSEYREDILKYMRHLEQEARPKSAYMKKQQDITSSMRSILIDWLVEVSEEYKLHMETLYLAVAYTDRFLSQMSVLRGKLQLVGTASMYIASKYEEITPPDIAEFVYITDDTYTKKQVLRMEHLLLKVLDFRMSSPTANWFLSYFLRYLKTNLNMNSQRVESLSRYLAELSLIDGDTFLAFLPSQIAASAIYLSLYTLGKPWTKQIADLLGYGYELSQLKSCVCALYKAMQQAPQHPQQAIQEKYKQAKYDYASLIEAPKALPACFL